MFPFQVHFSAEIVSLLEKGAIEEIRDHPLLCFSPVFVVPKCSGSLRMILFEVNQSLFGQVPFSDGSSINLPSFFESGRRRSLPGSSRRLLSFLSIHVLGIVWGCLSGQVLPVQGSSLWAAPRSSVFTRNFRWSWRIFEDRVFVFSLFWTAVSWSRSRRFCCWIFRGFCSARLKISSFSSSGRFQNSSRLTLRLF